jgi:RimJ/RimL family protein N-acetyltransferase
MLCLPPFRRCQLPLPTANIDYMVDPALRRQGYGISVIAALLTCPQLAHLSLFVAGVEPANIGSVSFLLKNGFQPFDPTPDWEGTVYYAKGSSGQDNLTDRT